MGYQDLAYAIVTQAVEDYKERKTDGRSVRSLKEFFNSEWCATLLNASTLSGKAILDQLEKGCDYGC